jgi:WD40 repeat protein
MVAFSFRRYRVAALFAILLGCVAATGPSSAEPQVAGSEPPAGKPFRILAGHKGAVYCVAFSPDSSFLASGGEDGMIRIWEVPSGKLRQQTADQSPPGRGRLSWLFA